MFNWFKSDTNGYECDGKNCPHREDVYYILNKSLERERLLLMRLHNTMDMLSEAETKVYEYEVLKKARSKKREDAPIPSLLNGAGMQKVGEFIVPLPKKPGRKPKVKAE